MYQQNCFHYFTYIIVKITPLTKLAESEQKRYVDQALEV